MTDKIAPAHMKEFPDYYVRLESVEGEVERDRAERDRYGDLVVLGARVVPGARSVVTILAGTSRMPLLQPPRGTVPTSLCYVSHGSH